MTVAKILKNKGSAVHTILSDITVEEATRRLRELRVGALVALHEGGKIAGVFSERDLVRAIYEDGRFALHQPVSVFMTREVVTATPADSVEDMMERMTSRRIRHLPVVVDDRIVGLVSIGDLVKARIEDSEREAQLLKQYISAG